MNPINKAPAPKIPERVFGGDRLMLKIRPGDIWQKGKSIRKVLQLGHEGKTFDDSDGLPFKATVYYSLGNKSKMYEMDFGTFLHWARGATYMGRFELGL